MLTEEKARELAAAPASFKARVEALEAHAKEIQHVFDSNTVSGPDGKVYNLTEDQLKAVREGNKALGILNDAMERQREVEGIAAKAHQARQEEYKAAGIPFAGGSNRAEQMQAAALSIGERFANSDEYKSRAKGGFGQQPFGIDIDDLSASMKTTMTTSAGYAPANPRTNIVVPYATRRVMLQDFIPEIQTNLDAVKYMEETTFTNSTAGTSENSALPESAMAYTERTQSVETLGTYLPVTEQQLEIAEAIQGIIDQRLMLMYQLKEESDLLSGNGSSPNILGFLNKGSIQTQAKSTDPTPDCIYKLFTKLRGGSGSGFVEPSAVVMHPNDWQDIRILADANGNYIWGPPSEPGPERIWGKPIIVTTAITQNTALTGDFAGFSQIWRKRATRIDVGFQNDDFTKLKRTIRISGRLALVIYRAGAFGTATGI